MKKRHDKINLTCQWCKKPFSVISSAYKRSVKRWGHPPMFCCKQCSLEHLWDKRPKGRNQYSPSTDPQKCSKCKKIKPASAFSPLKANRSGLSSNCKECSQAQKKKRYDSSDAVKVYNRKKRRIVRQRNREYIYAYLNEHPCVDCGEDRLEVLEFDHVRGQKKHGLFNLAGEGASIKTLAAEIAKCEIRCAKCHRRKTAKQHNWHSTTSKHYNNPTRKERHKFVMNYLSGHPCVDCGEDDISVLDFDHVRGQKIASISSLWMKKASQECIEQEIAKCEVRCVNCHRIKTTKQFATYKLKRSSR